MPLFEYRCQSCGKTFEELVSGRERDGVACRHCGSARVDRLLSTFAVAHNDTARAAAAEPGPCGACGAPQRGACAMEGGEW
ncbi:MAG: zinc ribbon domain-containing protein [Candidatus Binatia bacterium]|nr:zinc ribbon domain-containing protein [Candidatus Binatia bacterium]